MDNMPTGKDKLDNKNIRIIEFKICHKINPADLDPDCVADSLHSKIGFGFFLGFLKSADLGFRINIQIYLRI